MKRYPDWPQRLRRAIAARLHTPHVWGAFDCALWTAEAVEAQTGRDFAARFRGHYSTEAEASELLRALGHGDLSDLVDEHLPRRAGRPQRGDAILHPGLKGAFLGIVWNGGFVAPGPNGLILWPLRTPVICWEVA